MRFAGLALALILFSPDALAWGLETHLYFAQWVLAALPFTSPDLRRAAQRLPRLVLAGACLPDLALAGKLIGTPVFRRAHHWATLRRMGAAPRSDEERALAIGYASHLVSDVIAHNHFVPEHEERIARVRHVTHAIAEFAMDQHLRPHLRTDVSSALATGGEAMVAFVTRVFPCEAFLAARGIRVLARADGMLRASPLPGLCLRTVALFYRDPAYRFERYLAIVRKQLALTERALAGEFVDWVSSDPEGRAGDGAAERRAGQHVAWVMQAEHDARNCGQ